MNKFVFAVRHYDNEFNLVSEFVCFMICFVVRHAAVDTRFCQQDAESWMEMPTKTAAKCEFQIVLDYAVIELIRNVQFA